MSLEEDIVRLSTLLSQLKPEERDEALSLVYSISSVDQLTSISNRRGLSARLEQEIARASRHKRNLSVLMMDIDHFKQYNDTYHHLQGDEALRYIAGILKSQRRPSDFVARYGGEEFVLVLPETDSRNAVQIAKNLFERLNSRKIEKYVGNEEARGKEYVKGKSYRDSTLSIGVASYPDTTSEPNLLLSDADSALYAAKSSGRNSIILYSPPKLITPPNPLS